MNDPLNSIYFISGICLVAATCGFVVGKVWQKNNEDNNKEKIKNLEKDVQAAIDEGQKKIVEKIYTRIKKVLGGAYFIIKARGSEYPDEYICLLCLIRKQELVFLDIDIKRNPEKYLDSDDINDAPYESFLCPSCGSGHVFEYTLEDLRNK